jgi:hypothetical protein
LKSFQLNLKSNLAFERERERERENLILSKNLSDVNVDSRGSDELLEIYLITEMWFKGCDFSIFFVGKDPS